MSNAAASRRSRSGLLVLRLVESAIMLAIGTVLSMFTFSGPWALGDVYKRQMQAGWNRGTFFRASPLTNQG